MAENKKSDNFLTSMGENVRNARRRQKITMNELADQAGISRTTMIRVESGHSGVAIGAWLSVLQVLGMAESFADSVSAKHDTIGISMMTNELPQRIHSSSGKTRTRRSF